ncbi:hyaluronan synthase [Actinoplanes tereljensis]|uniref:Glycosyltransferase 2-like domain-containing protein n=1 Tax=Paractinoplanes tereljensis TaxID=571912 RepID=A0A919NUD3_9ACTN|nr:glycosyltransferase family 2 protein [Actinoplanes tereljensis]GIF24119.1 hypothetical protein Ate02nite_68490 [Actinoplanes tereljensis]
MSPESLLVRRGWMFLAPALGILVLVLAVATRYLHHSISGPAFLIAWWFGNTTLLFFILTFLKAGRVRHQPMVTGRIVAIVPAYEQTSEDLAACVWSILDQRGIAVDEVHVVDDGSVRHPVEPFAHPQVRWHRTKNAGGHAAAGYVLDRLQPEDWDFVLVVDAGCVLEEHSVSRQLRAFSQPRVMATVGKMIARGSRPKLLTRIADLSLGASAAVPAARRSPARLFKIIAGMPVLYRARVPFAHRRRHLAAGGNDDSCQLAVFALGEGEVVGVSDALAWSPAATDAGTAYRQRLAWSTSWWRMIRLASTGASWRHGGISRLFALTHLFVIPPAVAGSVIAIVTSIWRDGPQWPAIILGAAYYLLLRYAAGALHLIDMPATSRRQKVRTWLLLTPVEAAVNLVLVLPIRYFALIALCVRGWRARPGHRSLPSAVSVTQLGSVYYSGYLPDGNGS